MTWLPKNFFVCSGSGTCIRWIPFYFMAVNQKIKMTSTSDKNKCHMSHKQIQGKIEFFVSFDEH